MTDEARTVTSVAVGFGTALVVAAEVFYRHPERGSGSVMLVYEMFGVVIVVAPLVAMAVYRMLRRV